MHKKREIEVYSGIIHLWFARVKFGHACTFDTLYYHVCCYYNSLSIHKVYLVFHSLFSEHIEEQVCDKTKAHNDLCQQLLWF